jgi:hypothetical protein
MILQQLSETGKAWLERAEAGIRAELDRQRPQAFPMPAIKSPCRSGSELGGCELAGAVRVSAR